MPSLGVLHRRRQWPILFLVPLQSGLGSTSNRPGIASCSPTTAGHVADEGQQVLHGCLLWLAGDDAKLPTAGEGEGQQAGEKQVLHGHPPQTSIAPIWEASHDGD